MAELSTKQLLTEVCSQLTKAQWGLARTTLDELVSRTDVREKLPALSTYRRSKALPASFRKQLADRIALVNRSYQARQQKLGLPAD